MNDQGNSNDSHIYLNANHFECFNIPMDQGLSFGVSRKSLVGLDKRSPKRNQCLKEDMASISCNSRGIDRLSPSPPRPIDPNSLRYP